MLLDDGIFRVYAVSSTEGTAPPPKTYSLKKKLEGYYGERVVGQSRYYEAAKVGQRIDRRIRIWRADISVRDIVELSGQSFVFNGDLYQIRKVTHTEDEDGEAVTDLDLEEADGTVKQRYAQSQSR